MTSARPSEWRTHSAVVVTMAFACLSVGRGLAVGEEMDSQLTAVGNEKILWLVVGQRDPEEQRMLQWFSYLDASSKWVRPARTIAPQTGLTERYGLVDTSLHVFFAGGSHYRYSTTGSRREKRLPDHVIPLAIAGGGGTSGQLGRLWAVVGASTARVVEDDRQQRLRRQAARRSRPGKDGVVELPTTQVSEPLGDGYYLVQYDGVNWQLGFAGPGDFDPFGQVWLSVWEGRHYLLWQRGPEDSELRFSWHADGVWTAAESIHVPMDTRDCFTSIGPAGLVLTAFVTDATDANKEMCRSWRWPIGSGDASSGHWEVLAPLLPAADGHEKELVLPAGAVATLLGEHLAVMQRTADGAQVGLWPIEGGAPARAFAEVPAGWSQGAQPSGRGFADLARMVVLGALVFMVFWRRQESLAQPTVLPAGVRAAGYGRRFGAAVLDILPAAAVAWAVSSASLAGVIQELRAAETTDEQRALLIMSDPVFWAWIWFAVTYTAYCLILELLMGATPGKKLFGCTVVSESMAPASPVQIVIRNLTRLLELEPHMLIFPFVVVIFLTQNRQRIGDLLARTLVVEGEPLEPDRGPDWIDE